MYVPNHFEENDTQKLQRYIRDYGFGMLVVADGGRIEVNHVPFYLNLEGGGPLGVLQCHVARKNPVWQRLNPGRRVVAVFQGPDAYVSPSWYPSKKETGRVVPTWNYLAVHAEGVARVVQDASWLKRHVQQLTDQHESEMDEPWAVDDAPADFIDRRLQAIVGIEVKIDKLTGKLKASQNQPERNRAGVRTGLEGGDGVQNRAMAKFIG